jgi:hypothetical protein
VSATGRPRPSADPRGRPIGEEPFEGFLRAIDVTRFESAVGLMVTVGLGALVAAMVAPFGVWQATAVGAVVAVALAAMIAIWERRRWRAQDVLHWYFAGREAAWVRDTGKIGRLEDPAAAEVWLGTHQPGSVPQSYRVIAAGFARDEHRFAIELARLPDATPEDRAWRMWLAAAHRWFENEDPDVEGLVRLVDELPESDDRAEFRSWLAIVEAERRWKQKDHGWLDPLEAERTRARRHPFTLRQRLRRWTARFLPVAIFAVTAVTLGSIAVAAAGETIRADYELTTYAIRGDLPDFDDQRAVRVLPSLERGLPTATRAIPGPLDDVTFVRLVEEGGPTLIWNVGTIEFERPSDADGHRVWQVEFILGPRVSASAAMIVTFDAESGPRYLYGMDPGTLAALRKACGLAAASPD